MSKFQKLPLHDGILKSIEVNWENGTAEFCINVFSKKGEDAQPHILIFQNIASVEIPRRTPWGFSNQINRAQKNQDEFQIEMQSGDTFRITAAGFSFKPSAS